MSNALKNIMALYAILALLNPNKIIPAAARAEEEAGAALIENLTLLPKVLAGVVVSYWKPFEYEKAWSRALGRTKEFGPDSWLRYLPGARITLTKSKCSEDFGILILDEKGAQLGEIRQHQHGGSKTSLVLPTDQLAKKLKIISLDLSNWDEYETYPDQALASHDNQHEILASDPEGIYVFDTETLQQKNFAPFLLSGKMQSLSKNQIAFSARLKGDPEPKLRIYDATSKSFFTRNIPHAQNYKVKGVAWCGNKLAILCDNELKYTVKFFQPSRDIPEKQEYTMERFLLTAGCQIPGFAGLSHAVAVQHDRDIDIINDQAQLLQKIECIDSWKMVSIPGGFVTTAYGGPGKAEISCFQFPVEMPQAEQRLLPLQAEQKEEASEELPEPRPIRPSKCKAVTDRVLSIFASLRKG